MQITFQDIALKPMPKTIAQTDLSRIFSLFKRFESNHIPYPVEGGNFQCLCASQLAALTICNAPLDIEQALKPHVKKVRPADLVENHLTEGSQLPELFVVEDGRRPVGWTNLKRVLVNTLLWSSPRLDEIFSPHNGIIVLETESVYEAHRKLLMNRTESAIVTGGKHIRGIIMDRDISKLVQEGRDIWNLKVRKAMREVPVLGSWVLLKDAYTACMRNDAERVVVSDADGTPLGTATLGDIVNALGIRSQIPQNADGESLASPGLYEAAFMDTVLSQSMQTGIIGLNDRLRVVYYNETLRGLLDKSDRIRVGADIEAISRCCGSSRHKVLTMIERARNGDEQVFTSWRQQNGNPRLMQCRINAVRITHRAIGYVLAVQDITSRHNTEKSIRKLAYYDSLTSLPNRHLFEERFVSELNKSQRHGTKLAAMMMDLNGFKDINDRFGHFAGDTLLRELGLRMLATVRDSDTVARFGGDEFMFLFPEITDRKSAEKVAAKLTEAVEQPVVLGEERVTISASIGTAIYPDDGADYRTLMDRADSEMYFNKRSA